MYCILTNLESGGLTRWPFKVLASFLFSGMEDTGVSIGGLYFGFWQFHLGWNGNGACRKKPISELLYFDIFVIITCGPNTFHGLFWQKN